MSEDRQNAIQLLTEDHRRVEALFEKFEKASGGKAKETIAREICAELVIHTSLEEEVFYPALRGKISDDDLDEAMVEHDSAKILIGEIQQGTPDEDFYDAKVKVLKEQIEHHVKEEERQSGNIFTQARRADVDLDALGEEMARLKSELLAFAKSGDLPEIETPTMQHEGA
ncbi:MAG TPA: hemerythrin domain-containing protein [Allosphingosinicella sp.]|jgi:hemerythrin superfamily protein